MILLEKQGYRALLQVAARLEPSLRRAFLEAVLELDLPSRAALIDAFERKDSQSLTPLWDALERKLGANLRAALGKAVEAGGAHALSELPESVRAQMRFDLTNPAAVEAVDTAVAAAVESIVNASHAGIQEWLRRAFLQGIPPEALARRLRPLIGLTPNYAQAVENYRQGLLDQDKPSGMADALAEQYAGRLLNRRALTIARTETMRAANAGQIGAWQDAQRQGLLPETARHEWIVTADDRLCPICEAIPDQNPDGVPVGALFQTDVGSIVGPPAHVMCRCVTVLVNP